MLRAPRNDKDDTYGGSPLKRSKRSDSAASAFVGLLLAAILWPAIFRSKRGNFWARMTLGAGTLGLYALKVRPELRKAAPRRADLIPGTLSAAGLYAIFQVGDRLARKIMPDGSKDIAEIYRLRTAANRMLIAAVLVTIIGPSEELFWRGLVQDALMKKMGRDAGTLAAATAYGVVHVGSGNLTLTGAASTAGAYWGTEYALRRRLGPLLVSHILWDVWIFLVAPTPGGLQSEARSADGDDAGLVD